jgi:hypothetical protein
LSQCPNAESARTAVRSAAGSHQRARCRLDAIHPRFGLALIAHTLDEPLQPDLQALRAIADPQMSGFKFFRPAVAEEPDAYGDGAGPRTRSSSVSWFTPQEPRGTGIHDGKGPRDVSLPSRTARRYLRRAADPGAWPGESPPRAHVSPGVGRSAAAIPPLRDCRQETTRSRRPQSAFLGRAIHSSIENWRTPV